MENNCVKQTYEDGTTYEGEMENGMRNGKGTYTFANGDVYNGDVYNGEWKNDERSGYGKLTYANGDIEEGYWGGGHCYEGRRITPDCVAIGSFFDGKIINAIIRFPSPDGSIYEVEVKDGVESKEKRLLATYKGEIKDGKANGKGVMTFVYREWELLYDGDLEGEFKDGFPNGQIKMSNPNTNHFYEGEYKIDAPDGYGKEVFYGIYEGTWRHGDPHGHGKIIRQNGDAYDGEFKNGFRHGFGKMKYVDRSDQEGEWERDIPNNQRILTGSGGCEYVGEWAEGRRCGQGKLTYENGDAYEGEWWYNFVSDGFLRTKSEDGSIIEIKVRDGKEIYSETKIIRPNGET